MNSKPLVSLLIANYNNGKFITETLDSALSQSYPNIEIVIVDDASTDGSLEKIHQYMLSNPESNINLYVNFSTYGCGRNKRKCIDASKGRFFAFLDPEDTIDPTAVEELMAVHLLNENRYGIVYSTHYLCNSKLEVQSISTWSGKIPDGQSNLTSTGGHISHFALFNRFFYDKTEGTNPKFVVAEDIDLYFKMEETAPVFYIDKPLYYYRKHDNNISWNHEKRYLNLYWRHKAELAAYDRRKNNETKTQNFTCVQLHHKKFAFYMQYAKSLRMQKRYFKSVLYNFKALPYYYTILLKNK
jgi:glycosyltransferase involved in cell wall biosynthesis